METVELLFGGVFAITIFIVALYFIFYNIKNKETKIFLIIKLIIILIVADLFITSLCFWAISNTLDNIVKPAPEQPYYAENKLSNENKQVDGKVIEEKQEEEKNIKSKGNIEKEPSTTKKDEKEKETSESKNNNEKPQSHKKSILEKNNAKANSDLQKLKDSMQDGDTLEENGNMYIVKRENGTVERYEMVSGFAGFSLVRTK